MSSKLSDKPCTSCGEENFHTSYTEGCPEKVRMDATGECFNCAFWEIRLSDADEDRLVIDQATYGVGPEPSPRENRSLLGMGGRRFDIELLSNGRRFTTHNLWSGGQIPERYRGRLLDNAKFVDCEKVEVGGISCWNSASEKAPAYPSYFVVKRSAS